MENLDYVIIEGNLTSDPDQKVTSSGAVTTRFTVAVNHREYGGKKPVSYIPVETWGEVAENCTTYLRKGSSVTIQGEIRQDRWEDNEGRKQSRIKIVAKTVRFNPSRKKEEAATDNDPPESFTDDEGVPF